MRKGLLAIVTSVFILITTTSPPLDTRASASAIWSIGVQDDSTAEFAGPSNTTFVMGSTPVNQFPPDLVGRGSYENIQFVLDNVSSSYLTVIASRSAANTGSGLQPIVNGHYLSPRWASTWQYNRTWLPWTYDPSTLSVDQGVIYLRWAVPPEHLRVGVNTITLRVVDTDFGDEATPSFDLDFLSLERGTTNFARPTRYVGTTDYWTNDAIIAQMKRNDFDNGGDGRVWLTYLLNQNTLDADLEVIEKLGVTASYPDVTWSYLEPVRGVWNDAVFDYYRYTFEQLQRRGVRVVAKIQYTPRWASTNPTVWDYDRYPAANEQDWINFLTQLGRRLGDVVDWWAVMNEVDHKSFWKGTMREYYVMMRDAYDALKASDTVDADGDGIAAYVVPSSSAGSTDQSYWQDMYANVFPRMDAFQVHDYRWGIEPGIERIHGIDPRLPVIISEFGPAWWFIDETRIKEYYPFAAMSITGYVLRNPRSPARMVMNWLFKGDPDRDGGPWPDPNERYRSSPDDPFAHDDGYSDSANSSIANYEPTKDGPPFVNVAPHSAGAYFQHQMWLQNLDGDQHPVEIVYPRGTGQVEISAVNRGSSIEVLASNFEGGTTPITRTVTFKLTSPWSNNKLDVYDADNYLFSEYTSGSDVERSLDIAMGMARVVISNAGAPADAPPGLKILNPPVPNANNSIVIPAERYALRVEARDDVGTARVEYRIDPVERSSYTPMSHTSEGTFETIWDARGTAGTHTIEVRVADTLGQYKTRSRVVRVGDPSRIHVQQVYATTAMGEPGVSRIETGTQAFWEVQIVDGTRSRYGLSGARVTIQAIGPDGTLVGTYSSTVDTGGKASFTLPNNSTDSPGTYVVRVTDVRPPAGKTYDPSANTSIEGSVQAGQAHHVYLPQVSKNAPH